MTKTTRPPTGACVHITKLDGEKVDMWGIVREHPITPSGNLFYVELLTHASPQFRDTTTDPRFNGTVLVSIHSDTFTGGVPPDDIWAAYVARKLGE